MLAISRLFIFVILLFTIPHMIDGTFGYVATASYNIGDDVQTLAAMRLLPKDSIPIDREFIGIFKYPRKVSAIINGWFMHTKNFCWYRLDAPPPSKSWPPSNRIVPLIISLHLAEGFLPYAFSNEAVHYLKKHAPIGARDLNTLNELQKRNIPSYFSGCLTLTLNNDCQERCDVIYAVDLDDECVEYIKSKTNTPVEKISHIIDNEMALKPEKRTAYLNELLEKYKRAKCVVTVRLHATMPCLAFETPVLLLCSPDDRRFFGLRELAYNCTKDELLSGSVDFDFDKPQENPKEYLTLRENLLRIVKNWVREQT